MGQHQHKTINADAMAVLAQAIQQEKSGTTVRRLQSVYLRGKGMTLEKIADVVQYHTKHVQRIWTQYFKHGIESILGKPRGGRRRSSLTIDEEKQFFNNHCVPAGKGHILKIPPLHQELCQVLGKNISLSTVYRIAKRHGWRKIAPRRQHPKRNPIAAELFKAFFP